jgi:formyltetrahydrofolate deformylase
MQTHILKLHCPDAVGLLARITGFIATSGGNLLEVSQYTDPLSKWFFSRLAFTGGKISSDPDSFRFEFETIAAEMRAEWTLRPSDRPMNAVLLTSRQDHCLADLLWSWRSGELNIAIRQLISNHGD